MPKTAVRVSLGLLLMLGWLAAADHVRSYHFGQHTARHRHGGADGFRRYRERLGPHSGFHEGSRGYLGYRERHGPSHRLPRRATPLPAGRAVEPGRDVTPRQPAAPPSRGLPPRRSRGRDAKRNP